MPHLFYAVSSWMTASRWRAIALAILLLVSMLAFGLLVGHLEINGPTTVNLTHVILTGSLIVFFWLTMVVVWLDPRKRPVRGRVTDWSQAIFLDCFLLFSLAPLFYAAK